MRRALLSPRKQPLQARSAVMVDVILEAAARVLQKSSLAGFNTNRVAEVAGISVGSLYQYFPNKTALVVALITREQAALADAMLAYVDARPQVPVSLAKRLAGLVDIAIAHQFGKASYAAALDHEEKRLPLQGVLGAAQQRIVSAVHTLLRQHANELPPRLPADAALDCLTITKALVDAEAARQPPNLPLLKRRVLRALMGYLVFTPASRAS
jgi:AcrR family transcriptional regulator